MVVRRCGFVSVYTAHRKRQASDSECIIWIDGAAAKHVEGCEQLLGEERKDLCESYQPPRLYKP
jgi:hypothetical protein